MVEQVDECVPGTAVVYGFDEVRYDVSNDQGSHIYYCLISVFISHIPALDNSLPVPALFGIEGSSRSYPHPLSRSVVLCLV
jgi:hypothetical protein